MTAFRPGDRVHLKGHAHTPATTGTVITETLTAAHVMWDDNYATSKHHPQRLEPAGEPMSADPRIEAAARAIYADVNKGHAATKGWVEVLPRWQASYRSNARAALAAADNAATITSEFELDKLPVGTIVTSTRYVHASGYQVAFQKLHDGEWHRGGRMAGTHPENFLPARVIFWGTE